MRLTAGVEGLLQRLQLGFEAHIRNIAGIAKDGGRHHCGDLGGKHIDGVGEVLARRVVSRHNGEVENNGGVIALHQLTGFIGVTDLAAFMAYGGEPQLATGRDPMVHAKQAQVLLEQLQHRRLIEEGDQVGAGEFVDDADKIGEKYDAFGGLHQPEADKGSCASGRGQGLDEH